MTMTPHRLDDLRWNIERAEARLADRNARTIRTRRELAEAREALKAAQKADDEAHRDREAANDDLRQLRAEYEILAEYGEDD